MEARQEKGEHRIRRLACACSTQREEKPAWVQFVNIGNAVNGRVCTAHKDSERWMMVGVFVQLSVCVQTNEDVTREPTPCAP